ncbi:MAG TPA: hypothetical protein HPP94_06240 [Desulfuromonadales bacterium]|nr:hypothetical protein [Desulfuromonadales bacterium]
MSKSIYFLFIILACIALAVPATAIGTRPVDAWSYYHFDGTGFTSGPSADSTPSFAVRERVRPVLLLSLTSNISPTALPEGSGVVAGICYIRTAGGKLEGGAGSGYAPYPRVPLLISSGGKSFVTVQTDEQGYFIVVLPAGKYSIGSGPTTAEIVVDQGITTLIPLQAGKRMVD